jgi:hypothetical protein
VSFESALKEMAYRKTCSAHILTFRNAARISRFSIIRRASRRTVTLYRSEVILYRYSISLEELDLQTLVVFSRSSFANILNCSLVPPDVFRNELPGSKKKSIVYSPSELEQVCEPPMLAKLLLLLRTKSDMAESIESECTILLHLS